MAQNQQNFQEKEIAIKNKFFKYYLSPLLIKNNFNHGFFTKTSSEINLSVLSKYLEINNTNCVLKQIHSNKIVSGTKGQWNERMEADGLVSDKHNQNLWIYTADCMPILFADKRKRCVAAIHCGRKGLGIEVIKNLLEILYTRGCANEDILVAIGPSISKKNYFIDKKTLLNFYKKGSCENINAFLENEKILIKSQEKDIVYFDLKKYAHIQLLNENIPNSNIDISNLCTYESNNDFHSWRRSKTNLRQWNFISP